MNILHTPPSTGRPPTSAAASPTQDGSARRLPELTRALTLLRRDGMFFLCTLALVIASVVTLAAGGGAFTPAPSSQATTPARSSAAPSTAQIVSAQTRNYPLAGPNPGLMQPAVDAAGNVWFGEMATNKLGRLDPRTGVVDGWEPPNGHFNIMVTAVDGAGHVWFTEQAANYIGRFDPASKRFTTYPLETVDGHSSSPQALAFDASGKLWFTELMASKIGRLDPATGIITTWKVPSLTKDASSSYPYALVPVNGAIWFGYLTGGAVGRLDPATGRVTLLRLPTAQAQIFSMTADPKGRVWFTELGQGRIGMVETATGTVREIPVPSTSTPASGLYAIVVTRDGGIWFACSSANALVRYDPKAQDFTFHTLAVNGSVPYGLALDGTGRIWFTADATPQNYVGMLQP